MGVCLEVFKLEKFGKSQSVTRVEDVRFLKGTGRYVDDIAPAHALHGFVFRSPVAHAIITQLDVSAARSCVGVQAVITAEDLRAADVDLHIEATILTNLDGSRAADPLRPVLATERVRFVGEPIAMVIAQTLEQARDAAENIVFEYQDLPVHLALEAGGEPLHEEAPDNIAFDWGMGDQAATEAVFETAAHRIALDIADNRIIVASIEPRGCFAEWEEDRLHVSVNGQGVWPTKSRLAKMLKLSPEQVRVTNPDVGGGFGMKGMNYPETFVCAHAARVLQRPVRWMSERTEAMLSDNAGRDLTSLAELAFDENHKMLAYRVTSKCNLGAYNSQYAQPIQTELFAKVLMGTYDVQTTWLAVKGVFTNTTQVDAYRGAGRPEAIFVLERLMDHAARELNVDPLALRRKNFIAPDAFPYRSATGEVYDVGQFAKVLSHAEASADVDGFADRKRKSAVAGKLRGLGLCYYIESILGDKDESAKVIFQDDGMVDILVGTQSNGQGHETVFAQFLSDQTGIPADHIRVVQGDSDLIARGGGTGGSRSGTVQANATLQTVAVMQKAFRAFLSDKLEVDADQIVFDDERFRAPGSNLSPTFLEVADMARAAGRDDLMQHSAYAVLDSRSFPNGAHICEVEIDPDTGAVEVARYSVVDDFGNLLNPMLVEGQVHGGVAQGIGQAISEHVVYDDQGQLLSASFMDYAVPRAKDVPFYQFETEPLPTTTNVMGMKGCGEAGTVGALAAVSNAVHDALSCRGVRRLDMPFTPLRVWEALNQADVAAE